MRKMLRFASNQHITVVLRYINHSCAPNCVAEVVTFERGHKIIISCVRRIAKGEEVGIFPLHCRTNIFRRVQA